MDVSLIVEPKVEARRRLQAYRAAIHRKADAEYSAAEQAYKEIANGRALINLTEAIQMAPVDAKGRPMLSVGRADRRQVKLTLGDNFNFDTGYKRRRGRAANGDLIRVPRLVPDRTRWVEGYALVPMVPPEVKRHHDLGRCHILWEVGQWADSEIRATPDRDPFLIRHIGGDLWAVLGEWELTDLERAIMRGRITS
jgi:hypothetical protein